jgi:FAD/FMN-containing dehydrogenase
MRTALDRAMRAHVPRAGAHGLVLGQISDANYEGAKLRLTFIYPRMLGSDVVQAQAIRQLGQKALEDLLGPDEALDKKLWQSIKDTLDPKAILNP